MRFDLLSRLRLLGRSASKSRDIPLPLVVLCLLPASFLCACNAVKPKPLPPVHATHDFVIQDGVVRFNGKVVPLGGPLVEVEKVLGKPSEKSYSWWNWDKLGFAVGEVTRTKGTDCMAFYLEHTYEWEPKTPFRGRLIVEGAHISADSSLAEINRQFTAKCLYESGFRQSGLPGSRVCDGKKLDYELRPSRLRSRGVWALNICGREDTQETYY